MCQKRSSKYLERAWLRERYEGTLMFRVDSCMANLIYYLNTHGCKTLACCCGHGRYNMSIVHESPNGKIWDLMTGIEIPRKKRFYKKDAEGYYFIPEVSEERNDN